MIAIPSSKCRAQTAPRRSSGTPLFAALLLALGLASAACEEKGIGRMCDIGPTDQAADKIDTFNSAALECPTRLCLKQAPAAGAAVPSTSALCTADCSSDKDCEDAEKHAGGDRPNDRRCQKGFFCGVADVVNEGVCCRKVCMCKDAYAPPISGTFTKPPTPASCLKGADGQCAKRL